MSDDIDISVVICTYNRVEMLEKALRSLLSQQTGSQFFYEIIVVDDGSTDGTSSLLKVLRIAAPEKLRIVAGPGRGVAAARNAGIAAARGGHIAFFDDDQLADPEWLFELWRLRQSSGALCVGGPRSLVLSEDMLARLPRITRLILGEIPAQDAARPYARDGLLCTGNMMVDAAVFQQIGVFNAGMLEGGEDTDLFMRMRAAGFACWFAPAAMVHHMIPPYRLEPKYLLWTAIRGGRCYAVRDHAEWGAAWGLATAALRLVHGLAVHGSLMVLASLTAQRSSATARKCQVARSLAYGRKMLALAAAGRAAAATAPEHLFRQERSLFSSVEGK